MTATTSEKVSPSALIRNLGKIEGAVDLAPAASSLRKLGGGVVLSASVQRATKERRGALDFTLWRGVDWYERVRPRGGELLILRTTQDFMVHGWFGLEGTPPPQFTQQSVGDPHGRSLFLRVGERSTGEEITRRVSGLNKPDKEGSYQVLRFLPERKIGAYEEMLTAIAYSIGDVTVSTQAQIVQQIMIAS